jgi:hypothetical protein
MRAVFISIGLLCVTSAGAFAATETADPCGGELVAVSASATPRQSPLAGWIMP